MRNTHPFEQVGEHFSKQELRYAREKTWQAVHAIAAVVKPGMKESEAHQLAKGIFLELRAEREWHPSHIRFGINTLNTFKEASNPNVVLKENDIFFIDLGLLFHGHEGDCGDTFVIGNDPDMHACKQAAHELFEIVKHHWRAHQYTGQALYDFAEQQARAMGWELNLGAPGHRVSDFPHSIYKTDKLAKLDFCPKEALWILEIQIKHPSKPYGAFYEDLLI